MPWFNKLEISNEFLVLSSTYFLFIYSDGFLLMDNPKYPIISEKIKDSKTQFEVGYYHVGLLGILVALNLIVMITFQIAGILRKIKLCCLKRRF